MNSRFPRLATALLAAAEIPWIWFLLSSVRDTPRGLLLWNTAVIAAVLATAAWSWLGGRRAAGHVLTACTCNLAYSVFWAVQQRVSVLWFSGIASAAAALLLVEWRRRRPEPPPAAPDAAAPPISHWIKENVEALVVAFIMALVIRCFCIEVFKIPSSSMEPTLMGDGKNGHAPGHGGDRIMVTKFYYTAADIERFDVVVFKFPLNQARNFIKRVVGLPGEDIQVLQGNIFFRPRGEALFRIARKTLHMQDSVWIDAADPMQPPEYLASREVFEKHWDAVADTSARSAACMVRDGRLSIQEREGVRSARFDFKTPIRAGEGEPTGDVRLAFNFEATSPGGELFAEVVNEMGRFEARLPLDAPGSISYYERGRENAPPVRTVPFRVPGLKLDRWYAFDLSIFDGKAYARLDNEVQADITFLESPRDVQLRRRAQVSFGSRDLTFRASDISVGRDIHYIGKENIREGEPVSIPPDHYVMMGDNVGNSHDSRAWTRHVYTIKGSPEPVECEGQEINDQKHIRELCKRYNLEKEPDVCIKADIFGNERYFYRDQVESEAPPKPFPFVHRRFIVGKAFLVWWPMDRWFRLIR